MTEEIKPIQPQPGFQEKVLQCTADIAIVGGAAGGGKSYVVLLEPLWHKDVKDFGAEIFRRTTPQIKVTGGIWDESQKLYSQYNATSNSTELKWTFSSGATIKFSSLQYEDDIYGYQSAQIPLIIFDELTHFSEKMFWYMISRNRSVCGVKPYVRATCNPDPDSFVARLIEWWIDQDTGFPIPDHAGVIRYFFRENDSIIWGDSKAEILAQIPHVIEDQRNENADVDINDLIKSFTFIPGTLYENKELLRVDPSYLSNLLAQDEDTKVQLLKGNWKVRTDGTSLFDYYAIDDMFDSKVINVSPSTDWFITCDAARFGRDLMVVKVWNGWKCVQIRVCKKTDVHDILREIEAGREQFRVSKSNSLVDQDGVGAATVKMGGYKGFSGGAAPQVIAGMKENYKNLKTQCAYAYAEKVNNRQVLYEINNETCIVDGVRTTKIKLGTKIWDIRELIRDDHRAIKRAKIDMEGKTQMNTKEEQKIILGRSPDFFDNGMMRASFEIRPAMRYV